MNNFYFYEFVDLFSCGLHTYSLFVLREISISKDQWAIFKSYSRKMKQKKLFIELAIDFYVHFNRQLIKAYFLFAWTQEREKRGASNTFRCSPI